MSEDVKSLPALAAPARESWLRRRLIAPLKAQLTQGTSPRMLAATLGVGTVCSLFPFLGFTALLNLAVGIPLRMNQPILQVWNQLLGPLQLALILVYVRVGETLWGASGERFDLNTLRFALQELSVGEFLQRFGWAGIHAGTAWLLSAPGLFALVYFIARPLLERAARLRRP